MATVGIVWIRCSPDMVLLLVDGGGKSTSILMQGDSIIIAKTNQTT